MVHGTKTFIISVSLFFIALPLIHFTPRAHREYIFSTLVGLLTLAALYR
jgi:hypothetical protein